MTDFGSPIFAAWRAAAPEWDAYTRHRFVQGLADGTLPMPVFLDYLRQDYVFLIHFSRAWALGVVKAETLDEMQACAATVNGLLAEEMALHVRTCSEAGIDIEALEGTVEKPANMAYTRYVMDAGFSGDFLDLMAALAPCALGYGEIGQRLAREATSTVYRDWIDTYSGADYQDACRQIAALIERAAARRIGPDPQASPRWARLQQRFDEATRLEVGFWEMGLS